MSETAADQDYKVLTTPEGKHQVKVRNYTTGVDEEAIMELLMGANTTTVESTGEKDAAGQEVQKRVSKIDATVTIRYHRMLLDRFLIDVNGKTEGGTQAVFEMRSKDTNHVLDYLKELTKDIGGLDDTEKKS